MNSKFKPGDKVQFNEKFCSKFHSFKPGDVVYKVSHIDNEVVHFDNGERSLEENLEHVKIELNSHVTAVPNILSRWTNKKTGEEIIVLESNSIGVHYIDAKEKDANLNDFFENFEPSLEENDLQRKRRSSHD